jgi:hypothetical protein
MIVFGTFANSKYLPQLLSMLESFESKVTSSRMIVIALDQNTKNFVENLSYNSLDVFTLSDLENSYQELKEASKNRNIAEYFFTLTSVIPNFLIRHYPESDFVSYVDADLYFFQNPEICIYDLESRINVLLTPHNFSDENLNLRVYGEFNTGFIVFRNNSQGESVSHWWFERCLEWCKDLIEENKFADQKYLENFSHLVSGVQVSQIFGLNLGPWGLSSLKTIRGTGEAILVNDTPLIAFHFSGLRWNRFFAIFGLWPYRYKLSQEIFSLIYLPYLKSIRKWENQILLNTPRKSIEMGLKSVRHKNMTAFAFMVKSLLKGDFKTWKGILSDSNK